MRNYFEFGTINSATYGVYISGTNVHNAPERDYTYVTVPGRNGQLMIDNGRYSNIEIVYPAFITDLSQLGAFRNAMLTQLGYNMLSDSYNTDSFRMGAFVEGFEVEPTMDSITAGQFELTFNCKPQRFLNSGQNVTTLTESGTITNPTAYVSTPKIVVTGYGSFSINNKAVTITDAYSTVTIDSEIMDCYNGTTPANDVVSFAYDEFPVLNPGSNTITITDATITQLAITPRWWLL